MISFIQGIKKIIILKQIISFKIYIAHIEQIIMSSEYLNVEKNDSNHSIYKSMDENISKYLSIDDLNNFQDITNNKNSIDIE